MAPNDVRREAWRRLASELPRDVLASMVPVVSLGDVPRVCQEIVPGRVRGRVVVDVNR